MDVSVPLSAFVVAMALILQRGNPRFAQLSSAMFGLFYCGYLPSFWVKLRCGLAAPALNTSKFSCIQLCNWCNKSIAGDLGNKDSSYTTKNLVWRNIRVKWTACKAMLFVRHFCLYKCADIQVIDNGPHRGWPMHGETPMLESSNCSFYVLTSK